MIFVIVIRFSYQDDKLFVRGLNYVTFRKVLQFRHKLLIFPIFSLNQITFDRHGSVLSPKLHKKIANSKIGDLIKKN